jgi:hypothetical protein
LLTQQKQARSTPSPLQRYTISTPTWEVETTPGGERVLLNGTVQEVAAQLDLINPNWKADFNVTRPPKPGAARAKRQEPDWGTCLCNIRLTEWSAAQFFQIEEGESYLATVPGKPTAGPGPGTCQRVSCSYNSGIHFCNDVSLCSLFRGLDGSRV